MNLKLYLVLFIIAVSTIMLLNSGAVAHVKAISQTIYKWDGNNYGQVPGALEQISVGADGSVLGLNSDGLIYKYDGSNFVNAPRYLKEISVGNKDNVWGVVSCC